MIRKVVFRAGLVLLLLSSAFATASPSPNDLIANGRITEAAASLRARIQANPRDAEAYHLLGRAEYALQHWDQAISNGERAVAMQPNNSDYHLWLGRAYGAKADASNFITAADLAGKVRDQFERAVQLNGNNTGARADLAEFYMSAPGFMGGGKDKARAQAEQLLKTDPAAAHWIYGMLAEKDKKYPVAEQEFKASVKTADDPATRWLDLASFYRRRGRMTEMEDAVNNALHVPGRQPHTLYDAAIVLFRSGRNFNGAVEMLRNYIGSGDPTEEAPAFQAHYLLGMVLEKMGDRTGAAQEYRASLALAKDFQRAQSALKHLER